MCPSRLPRRSKTLRAALGCGTISTLVTVGPPLRSARALAKPA
jgi:hypothetical protein